MTRAMARATTPAAAYNNPNRPGTHLPQKIAPHFVFTEATSNSQTKQMSSRSTKIQAISSAKPSVPLARLSSPQNAFCIAQTSRRLHKPKPHSSILLLKNSNRTLNTSNKILTCTKHARWQFLIGTENALFRLSHGRRHGASWGRRPARRHGFSVFMDSLNSNRVNMGN